MTERSAAIAAGLQSVHERIRRACVQAQRDPDEITLVVVTKFFPASDVAILADQGVCDVGENRHQEAQEKAAVCADLGLRWHYIGGLQSNKAKSVASYADVVHSVDRAKLISGLAKGAAERAATVRCLIQVSLDQPDGQHGRAGADPEDVIGLADTVAAQDSLEVGGVMAVAPLGEDPAPHFQRLARISARLQQVYPAASVISSGMSGDLEQAIAFGATHVRVGRAVLGERPSIQ